jgi:hypothetical protein
VSEGGHVSTHRLKYHYVAGDTFEALDMHDARFGSGNTVVWSIKEVGGNHIDGQK